MVDAARKVWLGGFALALAGAAWWSWSTDPDVPGPRTPKAEEAAASAALQPATTARPAPPPPAPHPPVALGVPEPIRIERPGLPAITGRLWPADLREGRSPLIVALAGPALAATASDLQQRSDQRWLPVAAALRAQRPVALAVLDPPPIVHGDLATPATWDGLLGDLAAWLQPALADLAARPRFADATITLAGDDLAAVAAILEAARNPRVRAVVALSPPAEPVLKPLLTAAYGDLARRQIFVAWAADELAVGEAESWTTPLVNARRRRVPATAGARGLQLLAQSSLQADLVGWWFAALGPRP